MTPPRSQQWELDRLRTVALMAAILEAGDRAAVIGSGEDAGQCHRPGPRHYANRALELFDDADLVVAERLRSKRGEL